MTTDWETRSFDDSVDIEYQQDQGSPHSAAPVELRVCSLTKHIGKKLLFSNVSFTVRRGETLFIRGPSGAGKSQLLRSLAALDKVPHGTVFLGGQAQEEFSSLPEWRTQVTYISQSQKGLSETPAEFYFKVQRFASQRKRPRGDLPQLIHYVGLEQSVLNQPFHTLSGGQAQRVHIAIAVALNPAFLLLDEPTSALDPESSRKVERLLKSSGCGLVWVTHDIYQPSRVGGRVLELPSGILSAVATTPPISPENVVPSSLPGLAGAYRFMQDDDADDDSI
jgi:ABC-type iron transport system FetAB ATPase subunit